MKKRLPISRTNIRHVLMTITRVFFFIGVPSFVATNVNLPFHHGQNAGIYWIANITFKVVLVAMPVLIAYMLEMKWADSLIIFEIRDTAREMYKYCLVECMIIGDTLYFQHVNGKEEEYDIGEITYLEKKEGDIFFSYGEDRHRYTDYYIPSLYETLNAQWRTSTWE